MTEEPSSERKIPQLPSNTKEDIVGAVVRGAASSVPVFGGAAAELISLVIEPALEHRRDEWFSRLGEVVEEIAERLDGFDPTALQENEAFVTAVITTSAVAMRTHDQEKLRALRSAIVSSALPTAPEDHVQMMFIRFIDEFTGLHLRLLAYLRSPEEWFAEAGIAKPSFLTAARSVILETAMPELAAEPAIYEQAVRELGAAGLAVDGLTGTVSEHSLFDPLTSAFGNRFLDFISSHEG